MRYLLLKSNKGNFYSTALSATNDIFPLAIAVIPWGILCGSLAIQAGLTPIQAQMMSLFVFAGAAQLAGLALIGAPSPLLPILSSTFIISSRHLLYSAYLQENVRQLPWVKRVVIAFFLTDEMFAVACSYMEKSNNFNFLYAICSGVVFYLVWNFSTLLGIIAGEKSAGIESLGLDFAIAATFIAIVVPQIKNRSVLISVIVSAVVMITSKIYQFQHALIAATLAGMISGYITYKEDIDDNAK
ncbi:AzlC family ABC transporter permease [Vibrio caribbeanicus]|uniref:AzlC family ABC transporter permease n=1 Tax=Vibrio caribbeanicus TaxID=701175 RepID=UPI0030DDC602